ncbi:MAG: hypothetical protein QNI96_05145 [Woeseiaceae bacterium]|nr:hypothetical protein [Woeseiaceae bacterium]
MYHPYEIEEMESAFSRDHITEAYGPTAADAELFAISEMIGEALDEDPDADVSELVAAATAIKERWGL